MALTRGITSNFPCPVCLVPREEQHDVTKTFNLRSTDEMHEIYTLSQDLSAKDREEYLKDVGLRNVEVRYQNFPCFNYQRLQRSNVLEWRLI